MTDDVLNFLEETWGNRLRVFFKSGREMDCVFDGFSYDYNEDDNEVLELTFERLDNGLYIGTTPQELEKIETL